MDQVSAGELILPAPTRRARRFPNPNYTFIRMHFHDQEGRDRVRSSPAAPNREFGFHRNTNRDRLNSGDYHSRKASTNSVTSRTIPSRNRFPFSAEAKSGWPIVPVFEISWNSFTK